MKNTIKVFEAMRSIAIIAIATIMVFSMVACNKGGSSGSASAQSTSRVSSSPESDFEAKAIDGGKGVEITKYIGDKWEVSIPSKIRDLPVTSIGAEAFFGKSLIKVTIPNSVTKIDLWAFADNQLTSVTIPNSVTTIEGGAFERNQLTSVTIPNNITKIESGAFEQNQLTSVTIPNSVTTIGSGAFEKNQLTSVTIPNSVTEIQGAAFWDNPLTSVTIGANVWLNGYFISYDNDFESVYNNGKAAGTYTRPNTDSKTWTKQ